MAVTIPTLFNLRTRFGGQDFSARLPIKSDHPGDATPGVGFSKLVQNSTWNYATLNRRILLEWGSFGHFLDSPAGRAELQTTSASYETIFEATVKLSANTDKLSFEARGQNIDILITIWANEDKTSSLSTMNDAAGGTEGTMTDGSTSLSGDEDVTIEVQVKYDTSSPGRLYLLRVWEQDLVAADLPT